MFNINILNVVTNINCLHIAMPFKTSAQSYNMIGEIDDR